MNAWFKTYFYHFKSFFKIFNILNKDWKTIFEIIIKYHASLNFRNKKKLSVFVKSKFEWAKRNKITLYNYQDAIPRSSTMSEELGLEVWKMKTYLGLRAWTTTWTPKVDAFPKSSIMSEELGLEVWKRKAYLGLRAWITTWTQKVKGWKTYLG